MATDSQFCNEHVTTVISHTKGLDQLPDKRLFYVNLRYALSRQEWDIIRKNEYERAGQACEQCGSSDKQLHCHEQWEYSYGTSNLTQVTQKLINLVILCEDCHMLKHMGLVSIHVSNGRLKIEKVISQFLNLNPRCTEKAFWKAYDALQSRNSSLTYLLSTQWKIIIAPELAMRIEKLIRVNKNTIDRTFAELYKKANNGN